MMNKKYIFFIAALVIIASAVFLSQKPFFPGKLGEMELKLHKEGDIAIREVQNSHSARDNVDPAEAHIARYRSSSGNRATVSVTSAGTEKRAVEKVDNMTRGMGGMFSIPELLDMNGLVIYYTQAGGEYHYYYSKKDLVVWIALNNPDNEYRLRLIDEATGSIGGLS